MSLGHATSHLTLHAVLTSHIYSVMSPRILPRIMLEAWECMMNLEILWNLRKMDTLQWCSQGGGVGVLEHPPCG